MTQAALSGFVDTLAALYSRGRAYEADYYRPQIEFDFASERWLMLTSPATGRLLGWVSWHRLNAETLNRVKHYDPPDLTLVENLDLATGEHLYFSSCIVTPWAPRSTALRMLRLAVRANPGIRSFCWWLDVGDGQRRWFERTLH